MVLDERTKAAMIPYFGFPALAIREDFVGAIASEIKDYEEGPHGDPFYGPGIENFARAAPEAFVNTYTPMFQEKLETLTYGDYKEVCGAIGYEVPESDLLPNNLRLGEMFETDRAVKAKKAYRQHVEEIEDPYEPTDDEKRMLRSLEAFKLVATAATEHKAIELQRRTAGRIAEITRERLSQLVA